MKNLPAEYIRGIESRHNMSAGKRSLGLHSPLGHDHPLGSCDGLLSDCSPNADIGGASMSGKGGRMGSLPASNESVSARKGPSAHA